MSGARKDRVFRELDAAQSTNTIEPGQAGFREAAGHSGNRSFRERLTHRRE